ncbi:MAG: hypothetical protein V3V05_05540 [Pontiella sp.]
MKKIIACLLIATMVLGAAGPVQAAEKGRGGFMGFIAGCCFGMRAGADYNDGKEIVWREWVMLIPYVGIVFAIWNGIDGANGVTRAEYAETYGSTYF